MRTLLVLAATLATPVAAFAATRPLSKAEKKVVGKRLAKVVNYRRALAIPEGSTVFVVRRVKVPKAKLKGTSLDYEGLLIAGRRVPKGITIDERIDQVTIRPGRRKTVEISFRYAIAVAPGARTGGSLQLKLKLISRKGLGESVLTVPVQHKVRVLPSSPSKEDLTADFLGYRIYVALATKRRGELARRSVKGLALAQDARLPPLLDLDPKLVKQIYEFDKWRRRAWIAFRHLVAASKSRRPPIASLANRYLKLLNEPDDRVAVPHIPLIPNAEPIFMQATVENLAPPTDAPRYTEPTKPKRRTAPGQPERLVPLGEQTASRSNTGSQSERPPRSERPARPAASTKPRAVAPDPTTPVVAIEDPLDQNRDIVIDSHPRFLTLDDHNVAWGGSVRFSYAEVNAQESAVVPAAFFSAQVALTSDLGLELTLPATVVDLDVDRARSVTTLGNPLVAAKYRFHLPEIMGSRPVVSVRARWGIPLSPLSTVPPTEIATEDFSLPAHFADTYAFLLEKHDFGLGAVTSWQLGIIHAGAQVHLDYFAAVTGSADAKDFLAINYGASVGVRPFGDWLGAYVEARGTRLFIGPQRNELFTYLGLRGRLWDTFEPAAWVSLPLGSVGAVSGLQFGGEIRMVYDVQSIIRRGLGRRADEYDFDR